MNLRRIGIMGFASAALVGCAVVQPTPTLPSDAFVTRQPMVGPGSGEPVDHPGPLVYDAQHRPVATPAPAPSSHISKIVTESVKSPQDVAMAEVKTATTHPTTLPTTAPTTTPAQAAVPAAGQWESLGAVLVVVNGTPIYSHKVVNTLDRALSAEAKASATIERFKMVAEDLVNKQIREFIDNELEFAAAQRALEKNDEQIAKAVTAEWRKEQVRKAGGSEALARQRAAEDGSDFEELVQQQYRLNLTRLYYQRKIFPLIQVSAQDMRDYYQANLRQFQKSAAARFRVVWVSSDATGSRDAALEKARRVYERAKSGESFADLASKINDDPGLMARKGMVGDDQGWMEKGAYASEKVEAAVWELPPGQVTAPIDAPHHGRDGFYVAKLEELQRGQSRPFESQAVQDAIRETLRRQQFARLRDAHRRELMEKAVIRTNPDMVRDVMDMVMQRYPLWLASR